MAPMSQPVLGAVFHHLAGASDAVHEWMTSHQESSSSELCTGGCVRNWKIGFAAILFIEGLIFGHIVLLVRRQTSKSQRAFSVATSFGHALSAGVFFATGMLHIFPEAIEKLQGGGEEEEHHERNALLLRQRLSERDEDDEEGENGHKESHGFPWPFFVVVVAFYAIFFLDKVIIPRFFAPAALPEHGHDEEVDEKADERADVSDALRATSTTTSVSSSFPSPSNDNFSAAMHADESNDGARKQSPTKTSPQAEEFQCCSTNDVTHAQPHGKDSGGEENGNELEKKFLSRAFAVAILQILGFSAHSLFESIALGLSSDFSTILNVFIATASHRWATSAAIGFTAAGRLSYVPFVVAFLIFSAMVPLGVAIGAALNGLNEKIQGVLFAISAATFLYVGAFETMADVFVSGERRWIVRKFCVTVLGAAIIAIVTGILYSADVVHG